MWSSVLEHSPSHSSLPAVRRGIKATGHHQDGSFWAHFPGRDVRPKFHSIEISTTMYSSFGFGLGFVEGWFRGYVYRVV